MTKQPPAVPLPGPNVTPEPNEKIKGLAGNCSRHTNLATRHPSNQENSLARRDETASCAQTSLLNRMKKSRVWQAIVPGTQNKPQDTLQIRKTLWHGVTKQPPAVPLPGPNVTPEPNEKIKGLAGNCSRRTKQATRHPSNQENTLARRDETASCPEPNEKIRVWQAIVPGTQTKPQDTLQIRKTPWHGVTKQPPAVPLPGPNVTPEPNEKSRVWQAIVPGKQKKPQDTLQIRKTPWHGVTKQPPAAPVPGPNVNRMKKSRVWPALPLFQAQKPSHKTPFKSGKHPGMARRNSLLPSLCPAQTSLLNRMKKSIKGLAGNCSRHTNQATRHPSNQENTLARRDETASCRPSARAKRHS